MVPLKSMTTMGFLLWELLGEIWQLLLNGKENEVIIVMCFGLKIYESESLENKWPQADTKVTCLSSIFIWVK